MELTTSAETKLFGQLLLRMTITLNWQGKINMQNHVFVNVGSVDMDTIGHQVSCLGKIEFYWEDPDFYVGTVFRTAIDIRPYPLSLSESAMGLVVENPFLVDNEKLEDNLPSRNRVSETPTRPLQG